MNNLICARHVATAVSVRRIFGPRLIDKVLGLNESIWSSFCEKPPSGPTTTERFAEISDEYIGMIFNKVLSSFSLAYIIELSSLSGKTL